ncbi:hypothetical protein CAPTEDRAFT_186679 [Capitella teleta]|uniref:SOCS box domain-containing protein n=1 Tax=Capitella teleta TaxID=283909 RepID=R7TYB2_CAPTE|nr:hypothetical protein CAPTEDRAFT_186679 [Capitella teleta]|eukprot:ELT95955.1 hypothetical protein CAPTEDRAFT_186679 [Capitella teleta]
MKLNEEQEEDLYAPKRSSSCSEIYPRDQEGKARQPKGLFRHLSHFFALGFPSECPPHFIENIDDCRLLPQLLVDIMQRLFSADEVVQDFLTFASGRPRGSAAMRVFTRALLKVSAQHRDILPPALMVPVLLDRGLEDIVHECRNNPVFDELVEMVLHESVNKRLLFDGYNGSLLVHALNNSTCSVVKLLLKHGADVNRKLHDVHNLCDSVDDAGNQGEIINVLTNNIPNRSVINLSSMCRFVIRGELFEADALPRGIQRLPLPNIMKNYINVLE